MVTFEILFVLVTLVVTVALLISEKLRVDVVAVSVMIILVLFGLLSPSEAVAGFSNSATITVGAMLILSSGLEYTGAINHLGQRLIKFAANSEQRFLFAMMSVVAGVSAFINNTAAVAIFFPLTMNISRTLKISPSRLLIPLSFAAMWGGVCTLIGTSTNILVNGIALERGVGGFSMFEFLPLGLTSTILGILYMMTIGRRLIPDRLPVNTLTERYNLREYLTEVILLPDSPLVGQTVEQARLAPEVDLNIVSIIREGTNMPLPAVTRQLQAGDILIVSGPMEKLLNLRKQKGWKLLAEFALGDLPRTGSSYMLTEALVAHHSTLVGQTLRSSGFRRRYGAYVLGMQHHGRVVHENLANLPLETGDVLLLYGERAALDSLHHSTDFLLLKDVPESEQRADKALLALGILAGVVLVSALELMPIMIAAICGCLLMVLTGVLSLEEAYQALDAQVLVMLAGILSLGTAMETSGTAAYLADLVVTFIGPYGPIALVAAFYLITTLLTEIMSNNATAALLAPIAISMATGMGINPKPFLVAVTFAASASFMTPIGYQTNTMIYGPGGYRFFDYTRVGAPLNLLFWLVATILIPIFWPF